MTIMPIEKKYDSCPNFMNRLTISIPTSKNVSEFRSIIMSPTDGAVHRELEQIRNVKYNLKKKNNET